MTRARKRALRELAAALGGRVERGTVRVPGGRAVMYSSIDPAQLLLLWRGDIVASEPVGDDPVAAAHRLLGQDHA